jgi:uncharacterized protein YprB with RNaseH-like and TPR domain
MATNPKNIYEKMKRFQQNTSSAAVEEPPKLSPAPSPIPTKKLPEGLLNIPGVVKASNLNGIRKQRENDKERFLQEVGLDICENAHGSYAYRDTRYPASTLTHSVRDITSRELVIQSKDANVANIKPDDILFIDTETTGLAGGTGTIPFLIGAGFFEGEDFIVRQYFMRDYPDEPAVLHDLEELLKGYQAVSGFNSKCFDVPLIQARYMMNRMKSRIGELPHIDLLYPARRFWRNVLPDCRLGTIEHQILGQERKGDIPSELIPYVYFEFVRGQRLERMKPVLHHNNEDIATLVGMMGRICRMLCEPHLECQNADECAGAARCLDDVGLTHEAVQCLEHAVVTHPTKNESSYRIHKQLASIYKRDEKTELAVNHWHITAEWDIELYPRIELAKYYEHTIKDYPQAMYHTEAALQLVASGETIRQNGVSLEEIQHRHQRLLRKINGNQSS